LARLEHSVHLTQPDVATCGTMYMSANGFLPNHPIKLTIDGKPIATPDRDHAGFGHVPHRPENAGTIPRPAHPGPAQPAHHRDDDIPQQLTTRSRVKTDTLEIGIENGRNRSGRNCRTYWTAVRAPGWRAANSRRPVMAARATAADGFAAPPGHLSIFDPLRPRR